VKVLVVIDSLSFGGAENVLVTLAAEAPGLGLELDLLSLAQPTRGRAAWLPRLQAAGLEPRFLDVERLTQRNAIPTLAAAIRRSQCDVVHAHLETAITLAPIAARLADRPAVCTLHHVPGPLTGRDALRERLAVAVGSRSAGLIMVSQASHDAFAARYPRSHRPDRWQVIRNGVDLQRFRPLTDAERPGLPEFGLLPGTPIVSMVGHMRPGKGHEVAIRAWPKVLLGAPDARLLLIGDGPLEQQLRDLTDQLGTADRVVFAGARDDVAAVLRHSSLVVLPTKSEALPTVLMEAAASGVASVATAVGGVPEVIVDGETGWLVATDTADAFADALTVALVDKAETGRRGRAARAHAERQFGSAVWAQRLDDCYQGVARRRAPRLLSRR
jgi:glycosyltransferase involved in cell wall biosynthesis